MRQHSGMRFPSRSYFEDEGTALAKLEAVLWPSGPVCPHCGIRNRASRVVGHGARPGLWYCLVCRMQFRVTIGTPLEQSQVPANKWLLALALQRHVQISITELSITLGVSYPTAQRMARVIRDTLPPRAHGSFDDAIRRFVRQAASALKQGRAAAD